MKIKETMKGVADWLSANPQTSNKHDDLSRANAAPYALLDSIRG